MIAEELQDQAALYALDLLSATEAAAFERELASNEELRTLVRGLSDAASALALARETKLQPSAEVKQRIMQAIASESPATLPANVIKPAASVFRGWLPWSIAAALLLACGVLLAERQHLHRQVAQQRAQILELVALAPSGDAPPKALALVAWDNNRQTGRIKIVNLPAAARGKDYQLWAVDGEHDDPISAGVLRTDAHEVVQIEFKPQEAAHKVKAFAISLEREGGAPKKEGPILLVGKI